jgi:hypothetical protein
VENIEHGRKKTYMVKAGFEPVITVPERPKTTHGFDPLLRIPRETLKIKLDLKWEFLKTASFRNLACWHST